MGGMTFLIPKLIEYNFSARKMIRMTGSELGWLYHCLTRASNYVPNRHLGGKLHKIVGMPHCNSVLTKNRNVVLLGGSLLQVILMGASTVASSSMDFIPDHAFKYPRYLLQSSFSQHPIRDLFKRGTKHVQCSVFLEPLWHFSYAFPSGESWGLQTKV